MIYTPVALAAFSEFWRDRLEKEHGVLLVVRGPEDSIAWLCLRPIPGHGSLALDGQGQWTPFMGIGCCAPFHSLPEAICAAVHALAEDKRKAEKPKPSDAALRAAERLYHARAFPNQDAMVAAWAAIIDEEFAPKD